MGCCNGYRNACARGCGGLVCTHRRGRRAAPAGEASPQRSCTSSSQLAQGWLGALEEALEECLEGGLLLSGCGAQYAMALQRGEELAGCSVFLADDLGVARNDEL
jgi:hypothetical protein